MPALPDPESELTLRGMAIGILITLWLGGGVFVLVLIGLYRWVARAGARATA